MPKNDHTQLSITQKLKRFFTTLFRPKTKVIKLDRRPTILLQPARSQTENIDEEHLSALEDLGIDALRETFGTFGSTIGERSVRSMGQIGNGRGLGGLKRYRLYDAPVPRDSADAESLRASPIPSQQQHKRPTTKFGDRNVVHSYNRPGMGDSKAIHEHRAAVGNPGPIPTLQQQLHPIDDNDNGGQMGIPAVSGTLLSLPSVTYSGRSGDIWDDEAWERLKDRARERKNRGRSFVTNTNSGSNSSNLKEKGKEKSNKASGNHHMRKRPKGEGDRGV